MNGEKRKSGMGKKQISIKKNFIMNILLTMSQFIFPLISFPYVSRILQPAGLGRVSFAQSVIAYFQIIAELGIPTYGIRACARVRDDREKLSETVQGIFYLSLLTSITAYVLFAASLFLVPRFREERVMLLVISTTLFFNMLGMEWLFKGLEQYTYITVRSLICKVIAVIGMFLFIHNPDDSVAYGALCIFSASASGIFNFFYAKRFVTLLPKKKPDLRKHLKPVAVFFAMACATTIYTNLDAVMLGFMKTNEDVGIYNAAIRMKTLLLCCVTSLGAVLLPRAAYYVENGMQEEFRRITEKAFYFVVLVSVPLILYFGIFADESIRFLAGDSYQASVPVMQILLPTVLLIGITNVLGLQIMVPLGKEKQVLYSELTGAAVDFGMNLLLIPRFAAAGAAAGTLAAEAAVLIFQWGVLRDRLRGLFSRSYSWKLSAALLPGTAVACAVKRVGLQPFFALLFSASLFFGIYGILLILIKEPIVTEAVQLVRKKLGK